MCLPLPQRRGAKSGFLMNREMERGWKCPPSPPLPRDLLPARAARQDIAEPQTPAQDKKYKEEPRAQGDSASVTCACSSQHSRAQIQGEGALTQRMELLSCVQGGDAERGARGAPRAPQKMGEPRLRWR